VKQFRNVFSKAVTKFAGGLGRGVILELAGSGSGDCGGDECDDVFTLELALLRVRDDQLRGGC
jgi:hypothetical protein